MEMIPGSARMIGARLGNGMMAKNGIWIVGLLADLLERLSINLVSGATLGKLLS